MLCIGSWLAAANTSLPNGSLPGTMKITSSARRSSIVDRSWLLLAASQRSTDSRIICLSSLAILFRNLKNRAGADVVIDLGFSWFWSSSLLCELLQNTRECFQVQGLGKVKVKAGCTGTCDVIAATKAGDGHYRYLLAAVDFSQSLEKLKPIHLGHRDIGQDHVKLTLFRETQRVSTGSCGGHIR